MLVRALKRFYRALPCQCAVCHAWPAEAICQVCLQRFAATLKRCNRCAMPLPSTPESQTCCQTCLLQPSQLDQTLAAVSYSYPWTTLLRDFKFHQATGWARHFASLLRNTPGVHEALARAQFLLPMPLSVNRLQSRGFNQTQLVAHALSPAKLHCGVLLRPFDRPAQSELTREQRLLNVRGAYTVALEKARSLRGSRVVLLDDVMTSGASLEAAASVLRNAGVKHICALVIARAE